MKFFVKNNHGQAMVEYLLIFGMMALISVGLVKGFSATTGKSMASLGFVLTQHLSTGVCKKLCFYDSYINQRPSGGGP